MPAQQLLYVGLLFTLFVVPRVLQRFRVPGAISALAFGIAAGPGAGLLPHDDTVTLLSTLGIVSLFLFAGLDVSVRELVDEWRVLIEHVAVVVVTLALAAAAVRWAFDLAWRPAVLTALALFTPSTGFILDSMGRWLSDERDRFWVRSKAIATEIVALLALFVVLQSTSAPRLVVASTVLVAMIAVLPLAFRVFAAVILPHAPKSEFGFLMMVAVACALITRQLGVYYLVGAFVVGMAAQQFRERLPGLASERMLGAVEAFASLFVPFYFFHAGAELSREHFTWMALGVGVLLFLVAAPVRVGQVMLHRRLRLGEAKDRGARIATAMLPTTVFTLVLADIIATRFGAPPALVGGLVIYACATSLVPGLALRTPPPSEDDELRLTMTGGA